MDFREYLTNRNIFQQLEEIYGKNVNLPYQISILKEIHEELKFPSNFNPISNNNSSLNDHSFKKDIFGNFHEKKMLNEERKESGTFYTPSIIVEHILNSMNYTVKDSIETKKVIDISCGTGSFLLEAVDRLIQRFMKIYNKKNSSEFTIEQISTIFNFVQKLIFGVDINPIACILCQMNFQHLLFYHFHHQLNKNEELKIPVFQIINEDAISFNFEEKYDFVIGNPPYIFIRDLSNYQKKIVKQQNLNTNRGQYDYYQIFMELGINLLKEGGYLGYIVPDSLLALSNRKILRKFIYNTTKIIEIYYTGPEFEDPIVSNIIIILQREGRANIRENNEISVLWKQKERVNRKKIKQGLVEKWNYKFLINLDGRDIRILDYLNSNFPNLKDLIRKFNHDIILTRGVELTKEGKVIYCKKCQKYMPMPKRKLICKYCNQPLSRNLMEKIITNKVNEKNEQSFERFIYRMSRYKIMKYKYIDITKSDIDYKSLDIYDKRIIIRQLNENNFICATYDENFSLCSQSFYNLKIKNSPLKEFDHFYLLGLLNSILLSYYFIKSFGSYKKLFPRILIEKIFSLPIKLPENEIEKEYCIKIRENVKEIIILAAKGENFEKVQKEVDKFVFCLYDISPEDQENMKRSLSFTS